MVILMPLASTATAEAVADVLFNNVYRRFGSQVALVSDRDPKFTSAFWRAMHKRIGVDLRMSSAAHPQTDGRSEVTNKSVGTTLRILASDNPDDWALKITACEFALNSSPAAATKLAPFEVVYGFLPSPWPLDSLPSGNVAADSRLERARLDWLRCTDAIIAARVEMVHHSNKARRADSPLFAVGAKVYLSTTGLKFPPGSVGKFIPKYIGPFKIIAADPAKSSYTLDLPPHLRIHPRLHASRLRPHIPNDDSRFPSRAFQQPPPVVAAADGAEPEWELEKVVGDRLLRGKRVFRVRYLGYSEADDEWRPEAELRETAPELLDAYLAQKAAIAAAREAAPGRRRGRIASLLRTLANRTVSSQGGWVLGSDCPS
ncbi:hypothetical protein JCM5296_005587 [Sporobolomyces johnsonii]